jgi:uncharacterized cupin superfamily protein
MPKIVNLHGDIEWDRTEDRSGWRSKDAWVGARIGAELIGGSLYELEPGDRLWPYHTHHANEEWLLVAEGSRRSARRRERPISARAMWSHFLVATTACTRSATGPRHRFAC